jgi:hypothetical protein
MTQFVFRELDSIKCYAWCLEIGSQGQPVHCQGLFHLSTDSDALIGAVDLAHYAGTLMEVSEAYVFGCIRLSARQVSIHSKEDLSALPSVCLG